MTAPTPDTLRHVAQRIAAGDLDAAERDLTAFMASVDLEARPEDMTYLVFGGALARRISSEASAQANLYLDDVLVGDGGRERDEGDMGGEQPSEWSLRLAEQTVRAAAERHGIACTFYPIHAVAERMTQEQWRQLEAIADAPIINASFALHHILDLNHEDVRGHVLGQLRRLDPSALLLSEPNVHHLEPDFLTRFDNCWHHFGLVFDLIDSADIPIEDRNALKVCFFGREILDILGGQEHTRTERLEATDSWKVRLAESGFTPSASLTFDQDPASVRVNAHDGFVGIDYKDETVVSVLAYTCDLTHSAPDRTDALADLLAAAAPQQASHRRPVDARVYLTALLAVAHADGDLHAHERAYIDRQARILGVDLSTLDRHGDVVAYVGDHEVMESTAQAILRDALLLASVDGEYDAAERAQLVALSDALGLADQFERIEGETARALSVEFDDTPSWFREVWFMSQRGI